MRIIILRKAATEALRCWERLLLLRRSGRSIQGGANLYLLDNCGANDRDKSCVYGLYDTPYGQTIVPGVCQVKYEAYHGYIIPVGFCAKP